MLNFFLCVSNPRSMLARASSANEDYTAKHLSMYPVQFHITYSFSGERTSVSLCFFVKGDLEKNVCFSFFQIAMHCVSCWNEDLKIRNFLNFHNLHTCKCWRFDIHQLISSWRVANSRHIMVNPQGRYFEFQRCLLSLVHCFSTVHFPLEIFTVSWITLGVYHNVFQKQVLRNYSPNV